MASPLMGVVNASHAAAMKFVTPENLEIQLGDPQWVAALGLMLIAILLLIQVWVLASRLGRVAQQVQRAVDSLSSAQESHTRETTIEAVRRYETDPQLRESIRHIYNKTVQGTDYTLLDASDRFHVITLLNYFEGIACGIEQGILLEPLVKDYLRLVLDKNVRALLRGESGPTWIGGEPIVDPENYHALLGVHQRWHSVDNASLYDMLR